MAHAVTIRKRMTELEGKAKNPSLSFDEIKNLSLAYALLEMQLEKASERDNALPSSAQKDEASELGHR